MNSLREVHGKGGTARIVWAAAGLAAGILIGMFAGWARWGWTNRSVPSETLDAPAIVHEIQRLSQLVTVKYTVQKVVGLEEKKQPLGSEKLLLFVQADVLAGVDLSKVNLTDLKMLPDRHIHISLPTPQIVNIVIDDKQTKVWDRQITWWTPWVPFDRDLERQARIKARDAIEQAAIEGGILGQARQNSETAIRGLLETLGLKVVIDQHSASTDLISPGVVHGPSLSSRLFTWRACISRSSSPLRKIVLCDLASCFSRLSTRSSRSWTPFLAAA